MEQYGFRVVWNLGQGQGFVLVLIIILVGIEFRLSQIFFKEYFVVKNWDERGKVNDNEEGFDIE